VFIGASRKRIMMLLQSAGIPRKPAERRAARHGTDAVSRHS
jgi:hypothetical protein